MRTSFPKHLDVDPYLIALTCTVAFAAVFPARGEAAVVVRYAVTAAVALLFFLYGAKLSGAAVIEGMRHWRLQALVLSSTFVLFPLIGLVVVLACGGWLPGELRLGLMFVCVLPSTVQSSIAFTSIARGNVPAALCSASVSNLLGVVVTPLLVAWLMGAHGAGFSPKALGDIALQILLPFVAGQAVRHWLAPFLERHSFVTAIVDRGSILLVVYAAFAEGMVAGVWSLLGVGDLAAVMLLDLVMLAAVLISTTIACRLLGFSKEDEIAIVFCGSKKSMAAGIPMANLLFPGGAVAAIVLPLMLFHQAQLFACATLARRYARRASGSASQAVQRIVQPSASGMTIQAGS